MRIIDDKCNAKCREKKSVCQLEFGAKRNELKSNDGNEREI